MIGLGFLNEHNAPTELAKQALPTDLECPSSILDKTVVIFHDESTFQANDDQPTLWAEKGTNVIRPKSRGSGIMISDFIEETNGYLALTQEEYDIVKVNNPSARMYARELFEYGESKEGYWTSDKFMNQIKKAAKIVEYKYPKCNGWRVVYMYSLHI